MTDKGIQLPPRAWARVWRISGGLLALSVGVSMALTHLFMETFSAGLNIPGAVVAVLMPLALGGPMIFYLTLKHEQLWQANSQLKRVAATDWLTTCLNRGAFTTQVLADLDQRCAGRTSTGGSLLIADADDFKQVNDQFGHQQGDAALRLIADAIRASVRTGDLVGRLGGEEFGIYLLGADLELADQIAERIRAAVSELDFAPDGKPYPLSVSIGGATFAAHAQFNDLYRLADQRLYEAKKLGRDCVALMQAA